LVIGLRLKFFITIFIVLTLTAASVSAIHYHFFKLERLRLMELNLQQNATLLANSDLSFSKKEFSTLGHEFINDVIGDDKVNMIIAIYNLKGNILYRNDNAQIFNLPEKINPHIETWEDVEHKEYYIKYLNQKDSKNQRIIKVGMILNQSLVRWKGLNQWIFIFVGSILVVITVISFFLTFLLFRPVRMLAEMVNLMATKLGTGEIKELQSLFSKIKTSAHRQDEFTSLLHSLDTLANKVTELHHMTQKWSALMAHELKTPMTLLRMSIDELIIETNASPRALHSVETELKNLENIVIDFLEWASVENDSSKPEIHAINLYKRTSELCQYLGKTFRDTTVFITDKTENDFRIFCNPIHFDQMINNLLTNASKYGEGEIKILCEIGRITISDNGKGLPERVLKNFGKPFNKHAQNGEAGHGLGLAWVNTIVNKYDWKINISQTHGTQIEIVFPII
jgi:signal transduction histidine kinase